MHAGSPDSVPLIPFFTSAFFSKYWGPKAPSSHLFSLASPERKKMHLSEGFQHVWASCLTAWLRSRVHHLVYCCVSRVGYGKKRHRRGYAVTHSMVTGLFLCPEGRLDLPKAHVLRVRGKLFPKGKSRCCYQKEVDESWTTTQTHRCPLH